MGAQILHDFIKPAGERGYGLHYVERLVILVGEVIVSVSRFVIVDAVVTARNHYLVELHGFLHRYVHLTADNVERLGPHAHVRDADLVLGVL